MLPTIRKHVSRKYLLTTGATLAAVFSLLYFWLSRQHEHYILEQVEKQAIILHKQIVVTRQWVADHSYVLVSKRDGTFSGYVLDSPELTEIHGKAYTRITPAALTRHLSEYAQKSQMYSFHLTNIGGKNPQNRPDPFEEESIRRFRNGQVSSACRVEDHQGRPVFRYAAPLIITESCLSCHSGYRPGEIGGCISVLIPFEEARRAIRHEKLFLFFAMVGLTAAVIVAQFLFSRNLIFKPIKEIRRITERIRTEAFDTPPETDGDELKEFANLCYGIDRKLKNQHVELERKIQEATEDLKRANTELARLNHAKTEFFSDISHELRTPLTALKGAVDFLARRNACSEPAYLEIIRKNTDQLIRTIVDFLDYSRIEAGHLEIDRQPMDIVPIISEVLEAQRPLADKENIRLLLDAPEAVVLLLDRSRIHQAVSNLVFNALRYSPEQGTVSISVRRVEEMAEICVADQGPGIPESYQEAIFQRFYQAPPENGKSPSRKGAAGIGLAICKGIVEAHGGTIHVESLPGRGSRFLLRLPTGSEKASSQAQKEGG